MIGTLKTLYDAPMWLAIHADQRVFLAAGQPGGGRAAGDGFPHEPFDALTDAIEGVRRHGQRFDGVVVYAGPGRLTLVRGAVAWAMGLSAGWDVPCVGASLRDLLKAGFPAAAPTGPLSVLTEPVRRWPLVYTRTTTGTVRRTRYDGPPPPSLWKKQSLMVAPTAAHHVPQGITPLPWPGDPAGELLRVLPHLEKKRAPSHHLEYAREAL